MARIKQINGLLVGYNYILKQYYIENKSYTTYRTTIDDTLDVIEVAGTGSMSGVKTILEKLANDFEELYEVHYTMSSTGSHVTSLTFNDYDKYCLILDLYKHKIYIKNSNIVLDLSINDSTESRVRVLWEYYREHLGLRMDFATLLRIYNEFILPYYDSSSSVSVYNMFDSNRLDDNKEPLYYSNVIANNNFDGKGLAEYTATRNPNNEYTLNPFLEVKETNTNDNSITTIYPIPTTIVVGDTINISNAKTTNGNFTYSADGNYTIKEIKNFNTIITNESMRSNYSFDFLHAYLQVSPLVIESIDRDTSTITVTTTVPDNYEVGNIIHVRGTQQAVEGEQVTCDGEYTILSINNKHIQVTDLFPTNYTNSESLTTCTVSKHTDIGTVSDITEQVIVLYNELPDTVTTNSHILINNYLYTVTNTTNNTLTVSESIEDYLPDIAYLNTLEYYTDMLINVTTTTNEITFPITTFMLDDYADLQNYLALMSGLPIPSYTLYENMNMPVEKTITVEPPIRVMKDDTLLYTISELKYSGIFNP